MNKLLFKLLPFISFLSLSVTASDLSLSESRCPKPLADEAILYSSDFNWKSTNEEMRTKFSEIYHSEKRLNERAYFDGTTFVMPIDVIGKGQTTFKLTENFLKNIRDHVEQGLSNKYVDYIMFSDMGHSHFFIPEKFYNEELSPIPVGERDKMYAKLFAHEGLRTLYHTAEQLLMLDENNQLIADRHTQWRFYTRNLLGFNDGSKRIELLHQELNMANTARDYKDGYRYWGAGYNISANKNGCFVYKDKGEIKYFDISLKDLGSKPGSGGFDF